MKPWSGDTRPSWPIAFAASFVLAFTAGEASADCFQGEEPFFSCTFPSGKQVHVCHTDQYARYEFGAPGAVPELAISTLIEDVHLTPWPGVGRTIWEEVRFENEGYSYIVQGAIHREYPEDENADIIVSNSGGVTVLRGDETLASLSCIEDSIEFPWGDGIYRAKTELGQCYDDRPRVWSDCND